MTQHGKTAQDLHDERLEGVMKGATKKELAARITGHEDVLHQKNKQLKTAEEEIKKLTDRLENRDATLAHIREIALGHFQAACSFLQIKGHNDLDGYPHAAPAGWTPPPAPSDEIKMIHSLRETLSNIMSRTAEPGTHQSNELLFRPRNHF